MAKNSSRSPGKVNPAPAGLNGHSIHNEILLSLPAQECTALFSDLELVELPTHTIGNEVGEPIKFCYFVNSGLFSILTVLADGKSVEVGLAGKEGFVGLPLVVGLKTSAARVLVQVAATAFRIKAEKMKEILRQCPQLEKSLNRYSQALAIQSTQVAACNRLHEVEERLARWLLMCQDRIGGDHVALTQDFLAHMLGTRRASVTVAAGILHKAGLITYNRGSVNIVNRKNLEDAACECYGTITKQVRIWQDESQS